MEKAQRSDRLANNKKSEYISDFFRPKVRFDIAEYISNLLLRIDVSDGLIKDLVLYVNYQM